MPVYEPPADAALEEAAAAIAGVDAVVFAAACVAAHFAHQGWTHGFPRRWALGCGFKQSVEGAEGDTVSAGVLVAQIYIVSHVCLPSLWWTAGTTCQIVMDLLLK